MKSLKLFFLTLFSTFIIGGTSYGQWQYNGNDIYYNNGNVGINTTSPSAKLEIHHNSSDTHPQLELTESGTGHARLAFRNTVNAGKIWLIKANPGSSVSNMNFWYSSNGHNGKNIMSLLKNGNVGINTTSPKARLEINHNANSSNPQLQLTESGTDYARLSFNNKTNSDRIWQIAANPGHDASKLNFFYKSDGNGGTNMMTIGSDGKVGVNTSNPSAKFEIDHNSTTSDPQLKLTEFGTDYARLSFNNKTNPTRTWHIAANPGYDDSRLNFWYSNNGLTGKDVMTIKNDGQVGIGTSIIPISYKLAVNGKVKCREVRVSNTDWADFVFEEQYDLKSLEELERFIKTNRHLPDVPAEKEVLSEGTDLGAMDAVLLQKIEELTLYVIDLNKEKMKMKKRIEELEKCSFNPMPE